MQFEEVRDHFDALDLTEIQPGGPLAIAEGEVLTAEPLAVLTKVCAIYHKVRPFLVFISAIFFVPKKWRDAVTAFTQSMDMICPAG